MVARMTSRGWIISHRCSWIMVYVLCCNAHSESHSDPHGICMLALFYQLHNRNLFTQHVIYYGPRSILLHFYYRLPFTRFIYIFANYYLLPIDTLNPLFIANR
jgi:hypothetical protein